MSPTKGQLKRKIAVFDIETKDWIFPYAVGFYNGEVYKEFLGKYCIQNFIKDSVRHKYRGYLIYAHNGGKFDFNFLVEHLKDKEFRIEMIMRGSVCVKLAVYHNKKYRNCTKFVDSLCLLPYSLDKLTRDFNVPHKKQIKEIKEDYDLLYRMYKNDDPTFHKYLKYDVLGLYEVIQRFYNLIGRNRGKVGLTLASTSLQTFKNGSLKFPLKMTNKKLNDEMKQGYYGGRTEIFRLLLPYEGIKYYCYDVNSLYPFVMRDNYFPITKPMVIRNPYNNIYEEHVGISKCIVECPKTLYIPLLPYKFNHKLYFPNGKMIGYWDHSLLMKARELGYKIVPLKSYVFKAQKIFKDYVDMFYKIKKESKPNTAPYIISKLLLNSLYGKFAQRQESEKIIKLNLPDIEKMREKITDVVDIDNGLFKIKSESKGNHFIPQISIHVTALSQLELYNHMEKIVEKDHIVGYCDTDSIFTDMPMPTGDRLGELKEEYTFEKGYFLLPKTYCVLDNGDKKIKAKGFIPEFRENLTEDSFKKALFQGDYSDFVMESDPQFNSMKSSMRRHGTFISMDRKRKSIKMRYDKRRIIDDWNTTPIMVKDLHC